MYGMRRILSCAAALLMVGPCVSLHAAVQQSTQKPKKRSATKSAAAKRTPAKTASGAHKSTGVAQAKAANKSRAGATSHPKPTGGATATRKGKKGTRKTATTTWRNRQTVPTPDRYREVQSALAAKGYLKSENASGQWDQSSIDAMKKFQADQNIEATGKLNSLSLIALGLGPKYDTRASLTSPASAPALPGVASAATQPDN
jgi:hypothetical protein